MSRSGEFTTEQIQTALDPLHSSLESMASRPDLEKAEFSVGEIDKELRARESYPPRDDSLWNHSWHDRGNDVQQHKFDELTYSIIAGREFKLAAGKPPWEAGKLRPSLIETWYRGFGQTNTTENAYAILEQAANRLEELGNNSPDVKYIQANILLDAVESNRLLNEKIQAKDWQAETTGRAKELLLQARTEFFRDFSNNSDGKTLKKFIDAEAKLFDIDFRELISHYNRLDTSDKPTEKERLKNELIAYVKVQNDFYKSCQYNRNQATGALTEVATESLIWYALLNTKATEKVRVRQSFEREDRSNISQPLSQNFDLLIETAFDTPEGVRFVRHNLQIKSAAQHMVKYDPKSVSEYDLEMFGKGQKPGHYQLLEAMSSGDRRAISALYRTLLDAVIFDSDSSPSNAKGRLKRDLGLAITGK